MKATDSVEKRLATLLISLTICALSFSNSAMAGADIKAESTLTVQQIKPAKPSQYSGSGLMDSAYPGQAIAAIEPS